MTIRIDEQEILPSGSRTGDPSAVDLIYNEPGASGKRNENIKNIRIIVNVSAEDPNASMQVKITGVDPSSGNSYELLTGNSIVNPGIYTYEAGLDADTVSGVSKRTFLPGAIRIHFIHAENSNITYSASAVAQFDTYK